MKTTPAQNIQQLRALMGQFKLDAFIVPTADPHQSEYVHDHWKCREWISGFAGSAGTVAVLRNEAGLWTDGRYFIQAEQELKDSGITLFKMQMPSVPELIDWICDNVPENGTVGVDGRLITVKQAKEWEAKLKERNIRLVTDLDLITRIWKDRPTQPTASAFLHDIEYAGQSTKEKLIAIRAAMREKEADTYLLTSLYDIAWLFNLRGGDIPHCPVVMAYALITIDGARIFMDEAKLPSDVYSALDADGIDASPYADIFKTLEQLPETGTVYLDDARVNTRLRQSIPAACHVISGKDLTDLPKARKNQTQLEQWRRVHLLDGMAMVRFWMWLEKTMVQGSVNECAAADRLEQLRRSHPECIDLSFPSISAYGPNAAIVHYSPRPESCAVLEPNGLYLIDSGGQYAGGTTDITRTIALGDLTDEERTDYTLTLKGLINLSSARFLKGSAGNNLDVLARQPLWEHGLDYKHGTGHGVGHFLNVHEGPQNFSQHTRSDTPLETGMVITIEPGVYKEGRHGIRIENMVCVEHERETDSGIFLSLKELTFFPIDTTPLKTELLSDRELQWLDSYHRTVFEKLSPLLDDQEVEWLRNKTLPLHGKS
jgi:Xaa-Pro aminopeptidase